jgi:hypothetical protein
VSHHGPVLRQLCLNVQNLRTWTAREHSSCKNGLFTKQEHYTKHKSESAVLAVAHPILLRRSKFRLLRQRDVGHNGVQYPSDVASRYEPAHVGSAADTSSK